MQPLGQENSSSMRCQSSTLFTVHDSGRHSLHVTHSSLGILDGHILLVFLLPLQPFVLSLYPDSSSAFPLNTSVHSLPQLHTLPGWAPLHPGFKYYLLADATQVKISGLSSPQSSRLWLISYSLSSTSPSWRYPKLNMHVQACMHLFFPWT